MVINPENGLLVVGGSTESSGAPETDLSFVTATSGDILSGKVGADVNGNPVPGSIQTAKAPKVDGNVVTIYPGHVAQEQTVEVEIPASGGTEFYKCDAVYGPRTIKRIHVEGAGTTACNGYYELTDLTTEAGGEVWKHMTADLYYFDYWDTWCIGTTYQVSSTWDAYYRKYYDGWELGEGGAVAPVPTVTNVDVTLDPDVPKTWDGYKAVFDGQYYSFAETITTGLTYGTAFVPIKGRVYDSACTIKLAGVWTNIPQEGLIFYDPLNGDNPNVPEIGGEYNISNNPPSYKEIDGIACADFSTGQRLAISGITGFPANDVTLSCWAKQKDSGMYLILFGYGHDSSFEVCMLRGDGGNGKFGIERGSGQVYADVNLKDGKWHHLAATIGADGNNAIWVDGLMVHQFNQQFRIANGTLSIGTWLSGSSGSDVYMASARIYNRVLTADEIGNLAEEFSV